MLKLTPPKKKKKKRIVAVSWENRELLCVVATGGGASLRLEHTARIFCDDQTTDEAAAEKLAEALKQKRISSFELLIALPRSQVDVISLKLPPASDDEMPTLVRNEIMRQASEATEESLIDYVAPAANPDEGGAVNVSGAVVRGDAHARIETIVAALRQPPSRIIVRAHAIASMFRREVPNPPKKSMLLNLMRASADISILDEHEIVFTRNVQLGGDADDDPETDVSHLADEIRLTTIVAHQSASDSDAQVVNVYMFGDPQESQTFADQLGDEAQLTVTLLDPLEGVELPPSEVRLVPSHRLAALIGMVWDFLEGAALLDFANPKQPPPRPKTARKIAFYAAAALVTVSIVGYRLWDEVSAKQKQASELKADVEHSETLLKTVRQQTLVLDAVEQWRRDQTDWLGELHYLSDNMPSADKAVVRRLTLVPSNSGGGTISMSVQVAAPNMIETLETGLRDTRHHVGSQRIAPTGATDEAAFQFETRIDVLPPAPATSDTPPPQ